MSDSGETDYKVYVLAVDRNYFAGQYTDWVALPDEKKTEIRALLLDGSDPVALTAERKNQHGDWVTQSKMSFRIKEMMRKSKNWSTLEAYQVEALDMIATKMSRILSGDPSHEDHWDDIAGYAHLGKGGHGKA